MLQLSKSYKEVRGCDLNNGVFSFEDKKNSLIKLTKQDKDTVFYFVERGETPVKFEETLNVCVCLTEDNIALLGHECYSPILCKSKDVRASDLLYIFLSSKNEISKCVCYVYDMKRSFGGDDEEVVRFYDQCISTAKYALTLCYETNLIEDGSGFYNAKIQFGLITENYEQNSLRNKIDKLRIKPINLDSAFGKKMLAQGRQNATILNILQQFLNKKIKFNGKLLDLDVRIMDNSTHTMSLKFVDEHIA